MIQTYHGYFLKGRFVSPESVEIPDNAEAFVVITGKQYQSLRTKPQRQLEAFNKFVSAVKTIDDEPLSEEDYLELENNRADFSREVKL